MLKKVGFAGILILGSMALGFWIGRSRDGNVDLGAAPAKYVPSGTLKLVDNGGVELAKLGIDLIPSLNAPLRIDFDNGPDGYLGWYGVVNGSDMLTLSGPTKDATGHFGYVEVFITPGGVLTVRSNPPKQAKEIDVAIKAAYAPTRLSADWWIYVLFSNKPRSTVQTELASEDARLVMRDGTPFAVCGHARDGSAAIVFVSPNYAPMATIGFNVLEGNLTSPSFEAFDRRGQQVALLETDSPRGPRLSVASEDRLSNTGASLFTLDSTGTRLGGDSTKPSPNDGIVGWLEQPMYRGRLPIRLVDVTGKLIWSTGNAVLP